LAGRGKEATSENETRVTVNQEQFLIQLRETTGKRISELDRIVKEVEAHETEIGARADEVIPFKDKDFHYFFKSTVINYRNILQLRCDMFELVFAVFDHVMKHLDDVSKKASVRARIEAGMAILEIMEKIGNTELKQPDLRSWV
jgi:hypothetical protein